MMTADTWAAHLDQARDLHRRLPVFLGYVDYDDEALAPDGGTYIDLAKLCAAGVHTLVASIGFGCYFQTGPRDYHLAGPATWVLEHQVRRIAHVVNAVRRCPAARLVERRSDLDAPPAEDRVGVIVHLTGNAHTVDLDTVGRLFGQGVRATHPAMQYHNRWCTGMDGLPGPAMTDFGRDVVARLNALGVVLDVAHASEESARAMIETSSKPLIDSHTTSRDLVPSSRGLRDATLRLIAERGGVIGVHFADHMLRHDVWSRKYVPAAAHGRTPRLWRYSQHLLDTYQDPDERMRWRPGPPPPWDRKVVLTGIRLGSWTPRSAGRRSSPSTVPTTCRRTPLCHTAGSPPSPTSPTLWTTSSTWWATSTWAWEATLVASARTNGRSAWITPATCRA